ncbi:Ig-like domain-containing protein [Actinomadura sp. NBRC 104425]|uniref:L,D-transpeptidase n=1 Tax=Actinomadura sp. NBRC 104425 TaxID=3032204 RepID=UPI0025522AB6|nr:Ig-like domain-containing protein [Actinomadura sp. NBRC 104425]
MRVGSWGTRGVGRPAATVRRRCGPAGPRPRRTALLLGAVLAVAGGAAACDGGERGPDPREAVRLEVTPADGSALIRPDSPIDVRARNGTIENVTVTTKGTRVEGGLNRERDRWRSRWTLDPDTHYTVVATAVGRDGRTRTVTSVFGTARPDRTLEAALSAPDHGETVGVGMPIVLRFEQEVTDRAAVERALELTSSRPVEGAWHWFDGQSLVFRTRNYWPAQTDVRFRAHLSGLHAGGGLYGTRNLDVRFRVGDQHIIRADEDSHQMWVMRNGRLVRTIPISMGRGGIEKYTTTNGVHLTMEKGNPVIMDSSTVGCGPDCPDYYRQVVYYAVRISNSGEYVHSAPWSVGSQGSENVSHGCVNASPENARWFYDFVYRGDPLTVTGSSRELEPDNGWGYWQMKWDDWVRGSALNRSLLVGPNGSTPVRSTVQAPSQAGPRSSPGAHGGRGTATGD